MVKVKFRGSFNVMYRSLIEKDPELSDLIADRIRMFEKNPNDTRLKNHVLKRGLKGKWAFSITSDMRIVYEWVAKNTVRFLAIGPHKSVYPKS